MRRRTVSRTPWSPSPLATVGLLVLLAAATTAVAPGHALMTGALGVEGASVVERVWSWAAIAMSSGEGRPPSLLQGRGACS